MNRIVLTVVILVVLVAGWLVAGVDRGQPDLVENTGASAAVEDGAMQHDLASIERVVEQEREVASAEVASGEFSSDQQAELVADPNGQLALGALHVTVRWSDGVPAPGVGVALESRAARSGVMRRVRLSTDESGVVRFDELTPGKYTVLTSRTEEGDGEKVAVAGGKTELLDLELSAGLQVVGRVTNTNGDALDGAEIWLEGTPGGWASGEVVAVTDQAGEYRLRDVLGSPSLGALAEGYGPSALVDLELLDKSSQPIRVDLVVSLGGGSLEGVVTNAEGEPVEDAVVATGHHDGTYDIRSDDTVVETWTFRHTTTDAEGRYRFGTLATGETPLAVRKPGHAPSHGSVVIERLAAQRQDVQLDRGARVMGRVTDAAGTPIEGARIQAFTEPLSEDFLQSGQVDFDGPFAQEEAVAGKGGTYELERLPHQLMYLYALGPRAERRSMGGIVQFTRAEIDLSEGGQRTWNPTLSDGPAITGIVRYRDGEPIENVFVNIMVTEGVDPFRRATHTSDGSFKFIQLPGAAYTVRAQIWDLPHGAKEPRLTNVAPGGEPIELVADFDAPVQYEKSRVTVRFADTANRTGGGSVSISLQNQIRYSSRWGDQDADGLWSFTLDTPGRFRPIAVHGERLIAAGDIFEFTPGEDRDLGVLHSEPGGTLTLHLRSSEEYPPSDLKASVGFGGYRHREELPLGAASPLRLEGVEPGPGKATFFGDNILMQTLEFEINAGEETVLDVELLPAVGVPYRIDLPSIEGDMSLQLRFIDVADGSDAGHSEFKDLSRYPKRIEFKKRLGLGSYRFEVELSDGRRKDVEFTVDSLDPEDAPRPAVDLR
jgi:protocatechuate 3,4-dioxygenase beta subunit